jgi:hypothetical protein
LPTERHLDTGDLMSASASLQRLHPSDDALWSEPTATLSEPRLVSRPGPAAWGVWTVQLDPGLHRQRSRVVAHDEGEALAAVEGNLHRRLGKWIIDPFRVPEPW